MKSLNWPARFVVVVACSCCAFAQQSAPQAVQPIAPLGQPQEQAEDTKDSWKPDTNPVTGALKLTLGSSEASENKLITNFHFSEIFDSNPFLIQGVQAFQDESALGGAISLNRRSRQRSFTLDYSGSAIVSPQNSKMNTSLHALDVSEQFAANRWTFLMSNEFTYTPRAVSGAGGALGNMSAGLTNLMSALAPAETLLAQDSGRYTNTAVLQSDYKISSRTSLTFRGSYGFMHFTSTDFQNGSQLVTSAGLNHRLNAVDELGINYQNSLFTFDQNPTSIASHSIQFSFAHRLPRRMMLHVSAGPELAIVDASTVHEQLLNYTVSVDLSRNFGRTLVMADYRRQIMGGAGLMVGSRVSSVGTSVSRVFRRSWSASVSASLNRNEALTSSIVNAQSFLSGTVVSMVSNGASLTRRIGRQSSVYVSYNYQYQTEGSTCTQSAMCNDLTRHAVAFGFNWNFKPIVLK